MECFARAEFKYANHSQTAPPRHIAKLRRLRTAAQSHPSTPTCSKFQPASRPTLHNRATSRGCCTGDCSRIQFKAAYLAPINARDNSMLTVKTGGKQNKGGTVEGGPSRRHNVKRSAETRRCLPVMVEINSHIWSGPWSMTAAIENSCDERLVQL